MRIYLEFVERTFREALVRHLCYTPDDETIAKHAQMFIMPDGTRHLAWFREGVPEILGTNFEEHRSKVIATVAPFCPVNSNPYTR